MKRHAKTLVVISALLLLTCAIGVVSASAAAPVVAMGSVSSVKYTSAHVTGTLNPEDSETFYSFEYTTDPKAGIWSGFTFEGSVPAGSGPTTVEADLSGLKPDTEYFVRLAGWNFADPQVNSKPVVAFQTDPVPAPVVSISAPTSITASSAHFEGQVNPGGSDPAFDVIWHFQCTPSCPGLEGTLPADNLSHTVEAGAFGLMPGTQYEVSLVAENAGAKATVGPETFMTATRSPQVSGIGGTALGTEAILTGQVDPGGLVTNYRFDYGTTSAYGKSTPTKTIPAAGSPVAVRADIAGLVPGVAYHFSLVAENVAGSDESPDRTFLTHAGEVAPGGCSNEAVRIQQEATFLSDCRAYEQVTPADKNGADAKPSFMRMSQDGNGLTWYSLAAIGEAQGANAEAVYASQRSASGWTTAALVPSKTLYPWVGASWKAFYGGPSFPGSLSESVFATEAAYDPADEDEIPGLGVGGQDVYKTDAAGRATWISHGEGESGNTPGREATVAAVSEDGSTIFFTSNDFLTPEIPNDGVFRLYRWRSGHVEAVGRDENGSLLSGRTVLGNGTSQGFMGSQFGGQQADSVATSADGSTFVYGEFSGPGVENRLFLHEDGKPDRQISLSQRSGHEGEAPEKVVFTAATPSLGSVYFASETQLTDDAPNGGGQYAFDRATGRLSFVGPGVPTGGGPPSGLVKVSSDGSYVYFTSFASIEGKGESGQSNLYVRHGEAVHFIATLAPQDSLGAVPLPGGTSNPELTMAGLDQAGNRIVFLSSASLAAADNQGHAELYLYDADSQRLSCISCSPSGLPSRGEASIQPQSEGRGFTVRSISADGSTIAFTTMDSLLPRDANNAADVYEWREGTLSLISTGVSAQPSEFAGMSPDGSNIYMFTRQSLLASDIDRGAADIYDVRTGGGFLTPEDTPNCSGEACQGVGGAMPSQSPVSTENVSGAGNVKVKHKKRPKHKKRKTRHLHKSRQPGKHKKRHRGSAGGSDHVKRQHHAHGHKRIDG